MNILIVTGGSKGIGKALVELYASKNYIVYSLSRSLHNFTSNQIKQHKIDLTDLKKSETILTEILNDLNNNQISSISLINNAGRLGKIASLGNLSTGDIEKTLQLNTIAPLVLSNTFIKLTRNWNCKKQIISISSGAAIKPYEGWSVYCASKAAIDMMTRSISVEQENLDNNVKCISLYPGVVDTNMQVQIRKSNRKDFKNIDRFIDLKNNNELYTTDFVAQKIYELDNTDYLKNGDILDIRKLNTLDKTK